ncbi:hypothetical protein HJB79_08805 [Rhizobium lentis]|uniref:hypothetical protein n=1 Tax=Rhizobium lentis TaxID=1138194 RepID=UPI001C828D3F|nr:hypothetical protein [Rhizobium lentis]MBX5138897.1 hypothetical protein [Rhizobium lentis]MBX5150983.1 hypothetical protein [Rhizobium lentis]MBX5176137.1 hypothetical protein [Rhizobium lentis]
MVEAIASVISWAINLSALLGVSSLSCRSVDFFAETVLQDRASWDADVELLLQERERLTLRPKWSS